ncbi:MAG: tetratricopeptide repeat protein [Flammeovirgaceae bacterium]|nr:tetratricopeptide repeat protein [Flammeovirgaceae bacterium]
MLDKLQRGVRLCKEGSYEEATCLFQDAFEETKRGLKDVSYLYISACNNLADILVMSGMLEEAEILFKEVLKIGSTVLNKRHPMYAQCCNNLATLYHEQGKYDEAEVCA